jgi:hypothetical protein
MDIASRWTAAVNHCHYCAAVGLVVFQYALTRLLADAALLVLCCMLQAVQGV